MFCWKICGLKQNKRFELQMQEGRYPLNKASNMAARE